MRAMVLVSICRLVTYKRVDLIVKAFNKLPEKNLIIIGSGPELVRLKTIAQKILSSSEESPIKKNLTS